MTTLYFWLFNRALRNRFYYWAWRKCACWITVGKHLKRRNWKLTLRWIIQAL